MFRIKLLLGAALFGTLTAAGASAQAAKEPTLGDTTKAAQPAPESDKAGGLPALQNFVPTDQRGINQFEGPKETGVPFDGFKLRWGAAFTQQFQKIDHSNTAIAVTRKDANGKDFNANQLADIGWGFNLATANLNLNAQLAPGIRVALESYMSSRHHNEFWVKGGYLQIDESPIDVAILHSIMKYVTLKAGMFELNYGDAHFRRSDNGNTIFNPFVENYLLDAFNTEIGMEAYVRTGPWLAMVGVTDGVNKGGVTDPDSRGPAFLAKVGFDQKLAEKVRVRLTGSLYDVNKTTSANLYGGDRAGSRYYSVMENVSHTLTGNFTSGRLNPGFRNELRAVQVNPFVKVGGLELFGVLEQAEGKAKTEAAARTWNQYAVDAIYRFAGDALYVGGRYNTAEGKLGFGTGPTAKILEVGAERKALGAGWFVTRNILVKGEYVTQQYNDFPTNDIRNGAKFDGFVMEGAVSF